MRFDLDEQQRAFQGAVAEYLQRECPLERALAPHDHKRADYGIWRGLMDLGVGRMMVPEEFGGLGLGLLDLAVVAEPLGRFAAPGPFIEHALASLAIVIAGSNDQKAHWLPDLASGARRATVAFSESRGSWDAEGWAIGDGGRLSGTKRYVLHADGADLLVVGIAGGRLALVEGGAPGMSVEPIPCTDAGKQIATVTFDDTPFTLLDQAGGGRIVDAGLVLLAADAFGGASRCVEMAVAYAKERQQFGRPIGAFQAMKHQLADMAVAIEPAIALYWYAAHLFDVDPPASAEAALLAKSHITEAYPKIARGMVEAHGGIGYTWEYGAHIWLKRALFDQAYLGMPAVLRRRYAMLAGW